MVDHECERVIDGFLGWIVRCSCGREFPRRDLEKAVDEYTLHIVEFARVPTSVSSESDLPG